MSNRLLPYDTIIKAHEGDPIAIQAVLDRYAGYCLLYTSIADAREQVDDAINRIEKILADVKNRMNGEV